MAAKILLVEDSDTQLKFLKDGLIQNGFEVETAMNGAEAYKKLYEYVPDVVVSDITGSITLTVDPKETSSVILIFTDISIAEDTQGTISIEGYDGGVITYSQILDYLKETEAPAKPEV